MRLDIKCDGDIVSVGGWLSERTRALELRFDLRHFELDDCFIFSILVSETSGLPNRLHEISAIANNLLAKLVVKIVPTV